jgi:hypothetical protein
VALLIKPAAERLAMTDGVAARMLLLPSPLRVGLAADPAVKTGMNSVVGSDTAVERMSGGGSAKTALRTSGFRIIGEERDEK